MRKTNFLVALLCVSLISPVSAITIRHDRSDSLYTDLADDVFPCGGIVWSNWLGSGTLISPNWILTAAHCLAEGDNLSFQTTTGTYTIVEWFPHPNSGLDIAVARLSSPVTTIEPVSLYSLDFGVEDGQECIIMGAGGTGTGETGGIFAAGTRRAAETYVHANASAWGWGSEKLLTRFRPPTGGAANLEGGSAQGDSGGGLLLNVDGKYAIAGVLTWAYWSTVIGAYEQGGVFVRSAPLNDWIKQYATDAVIVSELIMGVMNPESFERYALTTDWDPNEAGDGWTISGAAAEIGSSPSGYGLVGNGLKLNESAQGQWYATLDQTLNPSQTFTVNFKNTATGGSGRRIVFSAGDADQGAFNVEIENGTTHNAWLKHYSAATSNYHKTYIPGASSWTPDEWYSLTVEMDFTTHTVRAKLDDNTFTDWVHMPQDDTAAPGPAYSYTSINTNAAAGTFNLDNYHLSVTPPAPSNPETFETYALTADWNPTEAGEGWTEDAALSELSITSAAALDSSQGLQAGTLGGTLADGISTWHVTSGADMQVFEMDFNVAYEHADRIVASYGGPVDGVFHVSFATWENDSAAALWAHNGTDYVVTDIPGAFHWTEWTDHEWHHLTVEMDFTTHTVRARFDDFAFTAWVPMPSSPASYTHDSISINNHGVNYIDNVELRAGTTSESCGGADLDNSGTVEFKDFAKFGEYWSDTNCASSNNCEGADLEPENEPDGDVDMGDLAVLMEHWLEPGCSN